MEEKIVSGCECTSVINQLIKCGYFPCTPIRPSLAIDKDLLEFIILASFHLAPNITAWAQILEAFWMEQGFRLPYRVSNIVLKRCGLNMY